MDDLLMLFAELAVAVAGFTAIVSVFGPHRGGSGGLVQAMRVRQMLEVSLFTMFASLLPPLIGTMGLPSWVTWRVAGSVMFVLCVLLVVTQLSLIRRRGIEKAPGFDSRIANLIKGMAAFGTICFLVTAVFAKWEPVASVYATGVFNSLCLAVIRFMWAATAAMDFGRSEHRGA